MKKTLLCSLVAVLGAGCAQLKVAAPQLPSLPGLTQKVTIDFSNKPITADPCTDCKTSFAPNEPVYARIHFGKPMSQLPRIADDKVFSVIIHNAGQMMADQYVNNIHVPKDKLDQSYFDLDILPEAEKATTWINTGNGTFFTFLGFMLNGGAQPKLDLELNVKDLAFGKVKIDMTGVTPQQLVEREHAAQKTAKDKMTASFKIPDVCRGGKFSDKMLSQDKLTKMFKSMLGKSQLIKVLVTEGDANWQDVKNDLGIPLRKETSKMICVVFKTPDGRCYFNQSAQIWREHEGGGKYGAPFGQYMPDYNSQLGCENAK